jgi:hypothetical protein
MTGVKRTNKKTTLAALAALTILMLAPAAARAQWTTSSSNDVSNTNTGNVGIGTGTSAPAARLDVRGSIALDGTVPSAHAASNYSSLWMKNNVSLISEVASGYSVVTIGTNYQRSGGVWTSVSTSMPTWSLSFGGGGSYDFFELNHSPSGPYTRTTFLAVNSSGNVGIGTRSPANALHVNSDAQPQMIMVSGHGGGIMNFMDTAAPLNHQLYQWRSEGGVFRMALANDSVLSLAQPNILVANSAGNIGIGTDVLPAKVSVATAAANDGLMLSGNSGWATLAANLGDGSFNGISRSGDRGVVYGGASVGSTGGGFVIAPWAGATSGIRLDPSGNVGIGTATPGAGYKLDVNGDTHVTGAISTTGSINAGGTITGATVNATYQDVAEWVPSVQKLEAGTVVVLDPEKTNHVLASTESYDTKVAGVVSARPGIALGEGGEGKALVATTGRVKVKVDATRAPIHVGDLLVTSDVEGVAMKSVPVEIGGRKLHAPGTIIGKALEPLASGTGEILVLLSLQ